MTTYSPVVQNADMKRLKSFKIYDYTKQRDGFRFPPEPILACLQYRLQFCNEHNPAKIDFELVSYSSLN